MKLVWRSRPTTIASSFINTNPNSVSPSQAGSNVNLNEKAQIKDSIPELAATVTEKTENESSQPKAKRGFWSWKLSDAKTPTPRSDTEKGLSSLQSRPIRYFAPVYIGFSAGLSLCEWICLPLSLTIKLQILVFICTGVAMVLSEFRLDQNYIRFSLLVTAPLLFCVSLVSHSLFLYSQTSMFIWLSSSFACKLCPTFPMCKHLIKFVYNNPNEPLRV